MSTTIVCSIRSYNLFIFAGGTMRALSKADLKPSKANMHGAASLWKEKQTLSLPPTCTQLVLCEKGKFSLDGSFSKNSPYKQKIIFHLTSIGKMSRKFFFLPWTVGRWYKNHSSQHNSKSLQPILVPVEYVNIDTKTQLLSFIIIVRRQNQTGSLHAEW